MSEEKSPWLSKTMWLGLVTSIASVASLFYPPVKEVIANNQELIGTAIGLLVMILRVVTKTPLKKALK